MSADITATSTDIFLSTVPNGDQGFLVIDPENASGREVIFYTSKTATKVTVPSVGDGRGQDDTTASSHLTGTTVICAPVAGFFEALQSGSALTDGVITNAKLASGTGQPGGGWTTWTPTFTNFTKGSATVTAKYLRLGKTVFFRLYVVLNGSTMGTNPSFTLPSTALDIGNAPIAYALDSGTTRYALLAVFNSTSDVALFSLTGAGVSQAAITSTAPMTWANHDAIFVSGTYEEA